MKIGQVIKKEREKKKLSVEEVASQLGVSPEELNTIEAGDSPVEKWFPLLCQLAVKLKRPTSRLLAKSGKSKDTKPGQAGERITEIRKDRGKTQDELAKLVNIDIKEMQEIEAGKSPIEKYGPFMLHFAEIIEQPVFNIYLPCGVLHSKLDDYP